MKLLWFPAAVKFYCHLSGARRYQTCRVTSVIIVGKKMQLFVEKKPIYVNIVYSINFFNYQKAVGYTKPGGGFVLWFFSQKSYVILGSKNTWESLLRATLRAHLYKGKCIF